MTKSAASTSKASSYVEDRAFNARKLLKGALRQGASSSGEDSGDSNDTKQSSKFAKPIVAKKSKKKKPIKLSSKPSNNAFVLKLYDRSVDLSAFSEDTPLYPICRAWVDNNPKGSAKKKVPKKMKTIDKKEEEDEVKEGDVMLLPLPIPMSEEYNKMPPRIYDEVNDVNLDVDNPEESKEILLRNYKKRWTKVRQGFKKAYSKYEERYAASDDILQKMFDSAAMT